MSLILLTGATGFVGRQIHRHLRERGHDVRVVIRSGSGPRLIAPVAAGNLVETDDIFSCDADWWADACRGVAIVIHAAWYVEHGRYLDAEENAACVRGSFALAQGAVRAGVAHVIGIGTCFEYRLPGERLDIDTPLSPVNFYAACKVAAYQMMGSWLSMHDTRFSWCRLFYLHGDGEHPLRFAAYLHQQLRAGEPARLSIGTQVRDFLDVADAGRMIADVAETGQSGAINICSGRPVTIRAFAEQLADSYGRRELLEFGTQPLRPSDPAAVVGICNLDKVRVTGDLS